MRHLPLLILFGALLSCGAEEPLKPVGPARDFGQRVPDMASVEEVDLSAVPYQARRPVNGPSFAMAPACVGPQFLGQPLCAASYFGGEEQDVGWAAGVLVNDRFVVASVLPKVPRFGPSQVEFFEEPGSATLMLLGADAKRVEGWGVVGQDVQSVEPYFLSELGLVASGTFGLARFDVGIKETKWRAQGSAATDLSVGDVKGDLAVLAASSLVVIDAQGKALGQFSIQEMGIEPMAVAIDDALGRVFVTGARRQTRARVSAFLRAYSYDGTLIWERFARPDEEIEGVTRGLKLTRGKDGGLYFVGQERSGGEVLATRARGLARPADRYATPSGKEGGALVTFLARVDPEDGEILNSRYLVAKSSSDEDAQVSVVDLSVHESGEVYLVGTSECCGPGEKEGAFLAKLSPTLEIEAWEALESSGSVTPRAVDVWGARGIVLFESDANGLVVHESIYDKVQGSRDLYFRVWPIP